MKLKIGDRDCIIYRLDYGALAYIRLPQAKQYLPELFDYGAFVQADHLYFFGFQEPEVVEAGVARLKMVHPDLKYNDITNDILRCRLDLERRFEKMIAKNEDKFFSFIDTLEFSRYQQGIDIFDIILKQKRGEMLSVFEDLTLREGKPGKIITIEIPE